MRRNPDILPKNIFTQRPQDVFRFIGEILIWPATSILLEVLMLMENHGTQYEKKLQPLTQTP